MLTTFVVGRGYFSPSSIIVTKNIAYKAFSGLTFFRYAHDQNVTKTKKSNLLSAQESKGS